MILDETGFLSDKTMDHKLMISNIIPSANQIFKTHSTLYWKKMKWNYLGGCFGGIPYIGGETQTNL